MNPNKQLHSRHRFWFWLVVWSLLVAGGTVYWQAYDDVGWTQNRDRTTSLIWLVGRLLITFSGVLLASYLLVRAWQHRPTSRKAWFWLGLASVAGGIGWGSWLMRQDGLEMREYSIVNHLAWILIWSVIFLTGALVLFSQRHFFRWLIRWRTLKWLLRGLTVLLLLAAVFYAEENWRGKRAWDSYRQQLEAQGEHLDFAYFIPPPVPDEQNFAMAPVVASSYAGRLNKADPGDDSVPMTNISRLALELQRTNLFFPNNVTIGSWQKTKLTDLKAWQDYYRTRFLTNDQISMSPPIPGTAMPENIDPNGYTNEVIAIVTHEFPIAVQPQSPAADVLLALSRYEAALAELQQAALRPASRFPLNYQAVPPWGIRLPPLADLKRCATVLQLRAVAEMQTGHSDQAMADVTLILRLAEHLRTEPFLLSQGTRIAMIQLAIQPLWEGLAQRQWAANQLALLEKVLAGVDAVKDYGFDIRADLAANLKTLEYLRTERMANSTTCMCGDIMRGPTLIYWSLPSGWFYLNARTTAEVFEAALPTAAEVEQHILSPDIKARFERAAWRERRSRFLPENIYLSFIPPLDREAMKAAHIQACVDMARIACALERYRQAQKGVYPEHLADLTPQFMAKLPHDIINGQPLHYRRSEAGSFLLYSVGWNGQDDNGTPGDVKQPFQSQPQGDWVWQYPAK